jgi:hypothetical protein
LPGVNPAIIKIFDEPNGNPENDLPFRFRDPLLKSLLKAT